MSFRRALHSRQRIFFDGAMGTILQQRGLAPGQSPERFCLQNPEVPLAIHTEYALAGADIVTTCTFGGSAYKLPKDIAPFEFNKNMAQVAKQAAATATAKTGRTIWVAGDVGPVGHFLKPLGDISFSELVDALKPQLQGLEAGGADFFLFETQFDIAECRAAVVAARSVSKLPIGVTMTFEGTRSLTGSSPEVFAETMLNLGVDFLGVNCGAGPEQMLEIAQILLQHSPIPVLVQPNAGLPELIDGETIFRLAPTDFAAETRHIADAGAILLGGCCGTTPAHIQALRQTCEHTPIPAPAQEKLGNIVLSSRSGLVRIGAGQAFCLIGERINPTGKKQLIAELQAKDFSTALRFSDEQVAMGTPVLDVNVGAPMVDETELLPELVSQLAARHAQALALDSTNPQAIALALQSHPASPLVNSISGEGNKMEVLGPLCRDFGAPFILLPLVGSSLPKNTTERISIIEKLLEKAASLGIPRRLIMVDVLVMAVSSNASAARDCLAVIRHCHEVLKIATVAGLSNISFGLPARDLLNASFLSMGMGVGLNACIANPGSVRLQEALAASSALLGIDHDASNFIAGYANWKVGSSGDPSTGATRKTAGHELAQTVEEAVIKGNRESILPLIEKELATGIAPFTLVQEKLIPAITEVGAKYERKEYFLPQLIRSAETMQTAFARLKPLLEEDSQTQQRTKIILATVEGDIHDIGKNIVSLMLSNHGFDVIDLGKDQPATAILAAAEKHKVSLIGLSALMTTTMSRMEETITLIKKRNLAIKVIVGGAVVTNAFAQTIGASYAADAVDAVRVAQSLIPIQQ